MLAPNPNHCLHHQHPDLATRKTRPLSKSPTCLGHRVDAWPLTLSGDEAQRVALARALVREPKLLLDEPFGALDALTRLRMRELVLSLWRAHRPAVLMVTHDVDEAIALADRILVLDHGRIVAQERIARVRSERVAGTCRLRRKLLGFLGGAGYDRLVPFPLGTTS